MKENLEKITLGAEHPGQICPVCGQPIAPEDKVVRCPRCRSVHHVDCWKNKGGCGTAGCPQTAKAVIGEKPAGDGPPPPVSKWSVLGGIGAVTALILISLFWPKPPDPALGRTKITVMGEAHYELNTLLTELTDEFNQNSSEIYIDLQLLPPGGMDQKLVVLIAAGEAPDLLTLSEERFAYFAEQEALLELARDEDGEAVYGVQHPAQLSRFAVWKNTEFPEAAVQVLHYFTDHIPPADLEMLKELPALPPLIGF